MSYLLFKDISQYQTEYNMGNDPNPIIAIKMSGGDAGLYYDSHANANYNNASNAGKGIVMYHFAGGGDPIAEADFFIHAVSPLAENDVLALDWEVQHPDPVGWCKEFMERINNLTGVWPWIYMNMSTANAHDWSPVMNHSGYWCAAPSYGFDDTLPVNYPQIAQQGPIVGGIDTDAFFGEMAEFNAYGWHAPVTPPTSTPEPEPTPVPEPEPTPEPTPEPEPTPVPEDPLPDPMPEPTPLPEPPVRQTWVQKLIAFLKRIFIKEK